MVEPGSPCELAVFARWCRALVDFFVASEEPAALLVADGPAFEQAAVLQWELVGTPPAAEVALAQLVPRWMEDSHGSQLAVTVPFDGELPSVCLLAVDEAGWLLERAFMDQERLRLAEWRGLDRALPIADWQGQLAINAGWTDLAKWRCCGCLSVCCGESAERPRVCEYCGGTQIDRVPRDVPLCGPQVLIGLRPSDRQLPDVMR